MNMAVARSYNAMHIGGWSENFITTSVLESLDTRGEEIVWDDLQQRIVWEGYKLTGTAETEYGDIAVLVRVWLTSDVFVDGVAFYEAKRQYFNADGSIKGFLSVKSEQLARLREVTHASNVIFYDVDQGKSQVHIGCVPNIFVDELMRQKLVKEAGRIIHRYGKPFVYSLGENLRGFSVDFSQKVVEDVKGFANSTDAPLVIINAAVGKMNLEPKLSEHCSLLKNYEKVWGASPAVAEDPAPPPGGNEPSPF
ncbi:hypothetical protein M3A49_38295 [Paraburkholderia sp. CNPSo 3076]|uniref:hypothetical protein n=1 Tax=Paraburkholderia sp. CNPSo 3076 TaxID=2940936 RepID=UPI002252803C|nr:hypothetical protein [Paraburkholderia sp. CNPSo 3076]MCX5545230.1 hypothetical protein [Paraburkholderia sp. CNPSo 3076]